MGKDALKSTAEKLVAHCRAGTELQGMDELYDRGAVSVEAVAMPGSGSAESSGVDAIKGKHNWWNENFTVNKLDVEGPFPHGDDRFAVIFGMDTTNKQSGERTQCARSPSTPSTMPARSCARSSSIPREAWCRRLPHGHFAIGGSDISTASGLWPVSSPKRVPRS